MASVQHSLLLVHKDHGPFKGSMKRSSRERPLESTPIKKRIMASMSPKSKKSPDAFAQTASVKTERMEEEAAGHFLLLGPGHNKGYHHGPFLKYGGALDLSPGLRHTLAQFTLSSQCSLGGPAAFSDHYGHRKTPPFQTMAGATGGPLLVAPDSSTDLSLCVLEGESISCFSVGGEWRLCLPQVLNTVLRDFTLQQINAMCDQLYVYCSRCDASQLHVLKVTGVLPPGAPSCGLITLTDAQRLCNALLQPGDAATDHDAAEEGEGKEVKDAEGFWVEHQCLGKCQGLFVPRLYAAPNLPCIRCAQCRALFSPKRFVMHSHHQPDKRTCHWGFDSAKWACYLQLGRKHLGAAEEPEFQQLLERMKEKFHGVHTAEAKLAEGAGKPKVGFDLGPVKDRLCGAESGEKAAPPPVFALGSHLHPGIKGDPRHLDIIRHSFYLYMQERLNESAVSPSPGKHAGPLNANVLHDLLSQADKRQDENAAVQKTHVATELQSPSGSAAQSQQERPGDEQPESVSIETSQNKRDVGVEKASRDSVVMEVLQLYRIQHEKLLSTLQRQQQLEKELEALRGGEVASCGGLLEAGQTEHAQRLWEEKRKTVSRVKQTSRHKADDGECQGESRYVTELLELRRRLDRAEEDREELQEELRREREAREMLERTIGELQQQMKGPVPLGSSISPAPSPNNDSQGPSTP